MHVPAFALPANATSTFSFNRIAGANDRYDTAAAIATSTFGTADTVLLASGENYPDALSGNYLAGVKNAPILLTPTAQLAPGTSKGLSDLKAKNVIILGGFSAVSQNVENQLRAANYTVSRVSGPDRYETAKAISELPGKNNVGTGASTDATSAGKPTAILASGQNFADALTAGPLGYAKKFPVEITDPNNLSAATLQAFKDLGITNVLVAGGNVAVNDSVLKTLNDNGITTQRLSGATRQLTAVAIANYEVANAGFTNKTHVNLANGLNYPDALAGGPHAGKELAPILLTDSPDVLGAAARDYLSSNSGTLADGNIFGGFAAVSQAVEDEGNKAARGTAKVTSSNATVAPNGTSTITLTGGPANATVKFSVPANCGTINPASGTTDGSGNATATFTAASNASGSCTITVTDASGNTIGTTTVTVTPAAAKAAVTIQPELVSAAIVSTTPTNQAGATPAGTLVRYVFDKKINGSTPVAADFKVYTPDTTNPTVGDTATVDSANPNAVLVNFKGILTSGAAGALTTATVIPGAVKDVTGNTNPEGDAGLNGSTTNTVGKAHVTDAPDLLNVQNVRTGSSDPTANGGLVGPTTAVDFVFDQPAFTTNAGGFHIVLKDGTDIQCFGPDAQKATTPPSGGTVPGGQGTTTITVTCADSSNGAAPTATITAADIARGYVEKGTVGSQASSNPGTPATPAGPGMAAGGAANNPGSANPLEASVSPHTATTATPDLVSVSLVKGSTTVNTTSDDFLIYTFDKPVQPNSLVAASFGYYTPDGAESTVTGTPTRSTQDPTQVVVDFGPANKTSVEQANGGFVRAGAVTAVAAPNSTNLPDERGFDNTSSTTTSPDVTNGPDLTGVQLIATSRDPQTNAATNYAAIYTFDKNVVPINGGGGGFGANKATGLHLYTSNGQEFTCVSPSFTGNQAANSFTISANQVECDTNSGGFTNGTGANGSPVSTAGDVGSAVLGTVSYDTVRADQTSQPNPEGARPTTGGTGTPAS